MLSTLLYKSDEGGFRFDQVNGQRHTWKPRR